MLEALCEGVVVGKRAGLPLETILEVVQASGFCVALLRVQGRGDRRSGTSTEHFTIDLLVKDQGLMLETAAAARVPMPGLAAMREVFQSARAQGYGAGGHQRRGEDAGARRRRAGLTGSGLLIRSRVRCRQSRSWWRPGAASACGRAAEGVPRARAASRSCCAPRARSRRRPRSDASSRSSPRELADEAREPARPARQARERGGGRRAAPGLGARGARARARRLRRASCWSTTPRGRSSRRSWSRPWRSRRRDRGRAAGAARSSTR